MNEDLKYTAQYEYAVSLVKGFLKREELLVVPNYGDHVYEDGLLKTLFTTDYSLIRIPEVKQAIAKNMTRTPESGQHSAVLTRMRYVYTDICAALGQEFVEQLVSNVAWSLTALGSYEDKRAFKSNLAEIKKMIQDYPLILVCVLGGKTYSEELLTHRRRSQNAYTTETIPGSLPKGA